VSRLANDGVLTVEAPAKPPSYGAVIRSRDADASPTSQSRDRPERRSWTPDRGPVHPGSEIITTG